MSQHYLDPGSPPTEHQKPLARISLPKHVSAFGFEVDYSKLLPGDILLFSPLKPGFLSKAIRHAQEKSGSDKSHSRWTHAALYVPENLVIEAVIKGIKCRSLYNYIGGDSHLIRARRFPGISMEERYGILIEAFKNLRLPYSLISILGALLNSLRGYWREDMVKGSQGKFCSKLCADAYLVRGKFIVEPDLQNKADVTPAHLSFSDKLIDVPLEWRAVTTK